MQERSMATEKLGRRSVILTGFASLDERQNALTLERLVDEQGIFPDIEFDKVYHDSDMA